MEAGFPTDFATFSGDHTFETSPTRMSKSHDLSNFIWAIVDPLREVVG